MINQDKIVYINAETYYNLIGEVDEKSYENFLINNPNFKDIEKSKQNNRKSIFDSNISSIDSKKDKALSNNKNNDYRYGPYLIWLEMYLSNFERKYGKFAYSRENISMKQKCEELLNYYTNVCNVENIEEIMNASKKGIRIR